MQEITQKIKKTDSLYLFHNTKEDVATIAKYCNMLADKVNELNEELQETKSELEMVRKRMHSHIFDI